MAYFRSTQCKLVFHVCGLIYLIFSSWENWVLPNDISSEKRAAVSLTWRENRTFLFLTVISFKSPIFSHLVNK